MGGVDKGLVELDGRPMVAHVLARLAPQVGEVLINANQNLDRYRALGAAYPVVPDAVRRIRRARSPGLHAGSDARHATARRHRAVRFAVPAGGSRRRASPRRSNGIGRELAVAKTFDQPHPVFALVRRRRAPEPRGAFSRAADARSTRGTRRSTSSKCASTTKLRRISQHQYRRRARAPAAAPLNRPSARIAVKSPSPDLNPMNEPKTPREISCADDYDPNSMPVERGARVDPHVSRPGRRAPSASTCAHRSAACSPTDVTSPLAVPGHDNSAMDGYAVRFRDLAPGLTRNSSREDRRVVRRQAER